MATNKYNDIITLPHHTSPTRTRMPIRDRAAQFAPFAALTGYDDMVEETARTTDSETMLGEHEIELLDRKLRALKEHEGSHPYIELTYFIPDARKSGGRYETLRSHIQRIDENASTVVLGDGKSIPFNKISALSSHIFTDEE